MLWVVFPDGKTGLSSLLELLLKSSSLDSLWSLLYSTLNWSLLHLTLYWSLLHLTHSVVSFTRPSLESPLLDPLLESSSLSRSKSELLPSLAQVSVSKLCPLRSVVCPEWRGLESVSLLLTVSTSWPRAPNWDSWPYFSH